MSLRYQLHKTISYLKIILIFTLIVLILLNGGMPDLIKAFILVLPALLLIKLGRKKAKYDEMFVSDMNEVNIKDKIVFDTLTSLLAIEMIVATIYKTDIEVYVYVIWFLIILLGYGYFSMKNLVNHLNSK